MCTHDIKRSFKEDFVVRQGNQNVCLLNEQTYKEDLGCAWPCPVLMSSQNGIPC